jgi:chemosensory pili system protein ChpA (sensor histidine kinase/response regulator)
MLSYQRAMARKLFVYDEALGELRLIAGRARTRSSDVAVDAEELAATIEERAAVPLPDVVPRIPAHVPHEQVAAAGFATTEPIAVPQVLEALPEEAGATQEPIEVASEPQTQPPEDSGAPQMHLRGPELEDELLDVFLEEVREVVGNGLGAISTLDEDPGDLSEQTTLRRAFHTLKGSSRMVGLNRFGEAAWSMEQLLNAWLAEQKPMERPLLDMSRQALQGFSRWALDIAAGDDSAWNESAFRTVAEAMRLEG